MIGQSRAAELLLDGRFVSPDEAAAIGLVHRVMPREQLQDEALALGHRLSGRSPVANRELKRMIYDAVSKPLRRALRMEYASAIVTMSTDRAVQDMKRYLAELANHRFPTDRRILDTWEKMLTNTPGTGHAGCP